MRKGHGGLSFIKRTFYVLVVVTMVGGASLPAYAATTSDTTSGTGASCSPVAPAPTGISKPTGSAADTYHYNSCTGLYENEHFTWSPATKQYSPIVPLTYTCDQATGEWHTSEWFYVASTGNYEQRDVVVANPPAGSVSGTCEAPPAPPEGTASTGSSGSGAGTQTTGTSPTQNTGNNSTSTDNNASTTQSDTNSVSLNNQIGSTATSGSISADGNTEVGNAKSGDASATTNIINSVNTTSDLSGGQVATFTKNIYGDVNGNIIIDPNQLQPSNTSLNNTSNVNLSSQSSGQINNNVNLSANSGDVNVSRNTEAGNATSGSASAMANVVNMLNSYISANKSFVGTINIYGNLHGNILMPPKFIDNLIATGAPHTTVTINSTDGKLSDQTVTNITNQVNSSAKSGEASSSQNTQSGTVASGSATTKVEVYNLTGHNIVGSNSLLVFVNVMGKWVGVILDAPAGTTSAMYGGNITSNNTNNSNVSATNNNSINNNITVSATSGDVNTSQNTSVGNAKSGDAKTAVSIANLSDDTLNLTGWFGILFINVYGNWYGNFGVVPQAVPAPSGKHQTTSSPPHKPAIFHFVPAIAKANAGSQVNFGGYTGAGKNTSQTGFKAISSKPKTGYASAVLAASVDTANPLGSDVSIKSAKKNSKDANPTGNYIISGAIMGLGLGLLGFERVLSRRAAEKDS